MTTQNQLRQRITDQIIEALRRGDTPPWRRPWVASKNAGHPANAQTKRPYSGVNPLLLQLAANRHGFRSKHWATFNQWQQLGGKIKPRPSDVPPGQWGTNIVLFKRLSRTEVDEETGTEEEVNFGFLKGFTVFCIDQVDGEHLDHLRVEDNPPACDFVDYEPAETAIIATGAKVHFGGERAYYRPQKEDGSGDFIQCPHKHQFTQEKDYYGTMFHELMHWSETRLDWKGSYEVGELRAEIGACYALAELGVPQSDDLTNHHAYVKHWLECLHRDPKFIFTCATAASKAADFVMSFSRPSQDDEATAADKMAVAG
ncbi:MAG TPA: ArdC-like ssDNA-binding domain-containing protein [Gemmatales bacterium]|nr:ArdC-like ssDNA-binding domain-containing protein [Gemmatales bacterium]